MAEVAAHLQAATLHVVTSVPEHEPRETDPHYHLFEQAKARLKRQGLWKCILDDHYCMGVPELHHSHLEFSQVNASDFRKVNEALGLHLEDDDEFQAWAESPGNLEVLCLTGDAPVRMADGSDRPLAKVVVGDRVIGHDLRAHSVTMTSVAEFSGDIVIIDGHRMTGSHPVLTPAGWRPVISLRSGDLVARTRPACSQSNRRQLGMLGADVCGLRRVKAKVRWPIVGAVPVDVMHTLSAGQRSAQYLLHHEPMLHDEPSAAGRPVDNPDIALRGEVTLVAASRGMQLRKRRDPAAIGAEPVKAALYAPNLDVHLPTAGLATHPRAARTLGAAPRQAAQRGARRIPLGVLREHRVVIAAGNALLDDAQAVAPLERWWSPVLHVERRPFTGQVYDIGVAGCRSFISGDLVVHNCSAHHRTAFGVHVLPGPLWEPMRFRKAGLEPPARFYSAAQWEARQEGT